MEVFEDTPLSGQAKEMGRCFAITSINFLFACSSGHVANAIRPPLFVTRSISFIGSSGCGANICSKLERTTSKKPSPNGMSSTSPSFYSMFLVPAKSASFFAWVSIWGVKSMPVTVALVLLAAVMAVLPVPHATSSIWSPEDMSHNLTRWAEAGRKKRATSR